MTEKYNPQSTKTSLMNNTLVDDNYDNIVLNKITKEIIEIKESRCCDSCSEKENGDKELNEERNLVIAKSRGLLGIHFCENTANHKLKINENIVIKFNGDFEFATIIETGELVRFRRDKNNEKEECLPVIDRIASDKDIERNLTNMVNSNEARNIFSELIDKLSLDMKLVDVHYQFDRKKLYFFYTADGRVDFRELAKKLASHFKTRIELRQIGVRDEAKRIGGLATCGREYCCSSFLTNFKRITTDIAVENNISTTISKYTGPCGKLKCCLSFEIS